VAWLLYPALYVALLGGIILFAAPPRAGIPDGVVRYVTKAVAARVRRSGLRATQEEDLFQEIVTKLWEREPDITAWASFSNREFGDPAYQRFHDLLISTVRAILDRAGRTRRVEGPPAGIVHDPVERSATGSLEPGGRAPTDTASSETTEGEQERRVRHYAPPDRLLTATESDQLVSREPDGHLLDLMLDVQRATANLPPPAGEVVTRKLIHGESWAQIAQALHVPPTEARRLYQQAFVRLAQALRGYASRRI
jgi:DNA-directed RNA polymerase specialized sigma24 family protein